MLVSAISQCHSVTICLTFFGQVARDVCDLRRRRCIALLVEGQLMR